jgi:putative acetyltransferase
LKAWVPDTLDIDAWSSRLNNGGVFIVEQKDSIVGFTRVDDHGYFDLLYVHPDYQRQGIGKMLIERIISWASEHNIKQLVSDPLCQRKLSPLSNI